jgi:hypothetical protein
MEVQMKRRLLLWGGFRLEPSRLTPLLAVARDEGLVRAEPRAAAKVVSVCTRHKTAASHDVAGPGTQA